MQDKMAVSAFQGKSFEFMSEELRGDVAFVLGVSRVPFVFRLLEPFTEFLEKAWVQIRPSLLSDEAEEAAWLLRSQTLALAPPLINWRSLYSPGAFETLRNIVNASCELNPKLLLMVSSWLEVLNGRPLLGNGNEASHFSNAVKPGGKLATATYDDSSLYENALSTRLLLDEIAREHRHLIVPEDYRILAAYPEFLRIHWGYLKPHIKSEEYTRLESKLIADATSLVHQFPASIELSDYLDHDVQAEEGEPGGKDQLTGLLLVIQKQLAGLILDMGFYRKSLV
ncbi:halocarboxylic acid dehydrogenase DehI family protein [Paenibacillus caui]|uniref:halocarboxylic acid dehydrogenase DehI family protein n=1 Tax=Paenibacillus caui TaxID=2873927 RepID=UPI001CA91916|nr:halocarboxylic acid dehydrogenase DehI family protein [Paenibacillus caui]